MASPAEAFDLVSERKEQLRKVFGEFEAKKFTLGRVGATWKDIEEHFKEIEACLQKTFEAYTAKEKAFEAKMKSVQAGLDKRNADLSAKEQASVARVQSQKDAAVAAILEQKRKLADDKRRLEAEKQQIEAGGTPDTDKPSSKKDTHAKRVSASSPHVKKASTSLPHVGKDSASHVEKADAKDSGGKEHTRVSNDPRPKLKSLCRNMDSDGLRKLIVENKKDMKPLASEVPSALKLCDDPAQLVLKTLDGYSEKSGKLEFSKDNCFACAMLLEALAEVLGEHPAISVKVKKSAKEFADRWKATLKFEGHTNFNSLLEGRSFLQFVAAFGLSSEYKQDELCDIVVKVARRKQTPGLFRSLGLSDKAPDVIDKLIKDGKPLQAVSFAVAFDLLEQFPPAPLLKAHIKDAEKAAKTVLKNGNKTLAAQNEAIQKELAALKAVSSVVSEYKLEGHYTLDYVEKQVAHLEKTKADKKRMAAASKPQQPSKRPRTDDRSPSGGRSDTPSPERPLYGTHDRNQYGGTGLPPFRTVGIPGFDRRPPGHYTSASFGGLAPNPTTLSGSYVHPSVGLPPLGYRSSAHVGPSSSLSGYNYASSVSSLGLGVFKPYL